MNITIAHKRNSLITLSVLLLAYYLHGDGASLLPLIALSGGGDGDGGGGGDCSGGDGGGDGGGDDGGGPASSTPFLCTWNGEKYCFENDFLFGKPTSLFTNKTDGIRAYEKGEVAGDMYKIQNHFKLRNGKPSFQIKEVEPEESFIDHISLLHFIHPKNTELIVDADLQSAYVFGKHNLQTKEGVAEQRFLWNGEDVSGVFGTASALFENDDTQGRFMEPEKDIVEIEGRISDTKNDAYLILKSYYRDWTLGEVFAYAEKNRSIPWRTLFGSVHTPSGFIKMGALVLTLAFVGALSFLGSFGRVGNSSGNTINDAKELVALFGTQRAHADVPATRSIIVEYWDGNSFNTLDAYSPRYYQSALNVFHVPKVAIQKEGNIRMRMTATRRHKLIYAGLMAPDDTIVPKVETLKITKAYSKRENKDYASVLSVKQSGEYLHMIPADVVDVEFESPSYKIADGEQDTYVFASNGVYTNLSENSRIKAGDWVSKLDPEAKDWLETMKSLQTDQKIS